MTSPVRSYRKAQSRGPAEPNPAAADALAERVAHSAGAGPDAGTREQLRRLGFTEPDGAWTLLAECHGAVQATDRIALLLSALSGLPDPGRALLRFARIVGKKTGEHAIQRLRAGDGTGLVRLVRLIGLAPGLADILAARPALLPRLLAGELGPADPEPDSELRRAVAGAADLDDKIVACRQWLSARRLGLGDAIIAGEVDAGDAGPHYTALAEATIRALADAVVHDFRRRHGEVAEARFAVFALGKLGGREMTAGSDLDLVLVYDALDMHRPSSGPHSLAAAVYYRRLCNETLAALTQRQGAEALYEIDVRLSPWARKAGAATSLESFRRYYAQDAWTWEHMALTRGRAIAGDAALGAALEAAVRGVLATARDPAALVREVEEMRRRIARHRKPERPWDVKRRPGGLVDLEFIVQYLMLREAANRPEVLATGTAEAADRLAAAGVLTATEAELVRGAVRLWLRLSCLARLTERATADGGERRRLIADIAGESLESLEREIDATSTEVRTLYERLVATPAAAA